MTNHLETTHSSSSSGLRSTLDSIKAPSSVKAYGRDFLGRFILDVITNCDEIRPHSCSVNWNIKSSGKRLALRLTVWLRDLVSTSYSIARSKSSITLREVGVKLSNDILQLGTGEWH